MVGVKILKTGRVVELAAAEYIRGEFQVEMNFCAEQAHILHLNRKFNITKMIEPYLKRAGADCKGGAKTNKTKKAEMAQVACLSSSGFIRSSFASGAVCVCFGCVSCLVRRCKLSQFQGIPQAVLVRPLWPCTASCQPSSSPSSPSKGREGLRGWEPEDQGGCHCADRRLHGSGG